MSSVSLQVELPADPMDLFDDLARSMAGVEELTTALSDRLLEVIPNNRNTGPTDLGLDDIKDAPETPKTPGVSISGHVGSVGSDRRNTGLQPSKSGIKRGISTASLAAMDSLRTEPDIWQVCAFDLSDCSFNQQCFEMFTDRMMYLTSEGLHTS
jgi:hypothetical protein